MNALIVGASGGLATSLAETLLARGWRVDLVSRATKRTSIEQHHAAAIASGWARVFTVKENYREFRAAQSYNAYIFAQALFAPKALVAMDPFTIDAEIEAGLTGPIQLTAQLLTDHPPQPSERRDLCFIGSTSAYAGFKNTTVYCAVKHGLLGFVRAMNDEYAQTDTRFWLFSMGTMDTEMGAALVEQDPTSFLQPEDVAARIADVVSSPTNLFEPEVIMRRRTIRFQEK